MSGPSSYPHHSVISLRWKDNDVYGHVNNVEYYSFFDTVINEYLITVAGLDIHDGAVIGLCAESHCAFKAAIAYPGEIRAGLAVEHLGTSSVRYAVGLFDASSSRLLAEGWFVHVFVDRAERRSTPIPDPIRASLEAIRR
jgi:acyl-CoA thioester hydrolase